MNDKERAFAIFASLGVMAMFAIVWLFGPVFATQGDTCPHTGGWTKIESDDLSSYPVDGATQYCFKYGSDNAQGCEGGMSSVWPPQTDGKYCGLSHWSYFMPTSVSMSPTPTVIDASGVPTMTMTPTVTMTLTPTVTAMPTATVTPSVTPTPQETVSEQTWSSIRAQEGQTYGPSK